MVQELEFGQFASPLLAFARDRLGTDISDIGGPAGYDNTI